MSETILRAEELSAGYGRKVVVNGLTLEAQRGRILTLIGPNGAGKSTVLKTICRQLEPIGGKVFIDGRDISSLSGNEPHRQNKDRIYELYRRCGNGTLPLHRQTGTSVCGGS